MVYIALLVAIFSQVHGGWWWKNPFTPPANGCWTLNFDDLKGGSSTSSLSEPYYGVTFEGSSEDLIVLDTSSTAQTSNTDMLSPHRDFGGLGTGIGGGLQGQGLNSRGQKEVLGFLNAPASPRFIHANFLVPLYVRSIQVMRNDNKQGYIRGRSKNAPQGVWDLRIDLAQWQAGAVQTIWCNWKDMLEVELVWDGKGCLTGITICWGKPPDDENENGDVTSPPPEPIDGGWSEWGPPCPDCFGEGQVWEQTRTCTSPAPDHGGLDCEGPSTQTCNEVYPDIPTCAPELEPIDCEWGEWSECSVTCGTGIETRSNTKPENGGADCTCDVVDGEQVCDTRSCEMPECEPDQDCEWGPWSPCDAPCDGTQTRLIAIPASGNGAECEGDDTRICNTDCVQGGWSDYSQCFADENQCIKERTCTNPEPYPPSEATLQCEGPFSALCNHESGDDLTPCLCTETSCQNGGTCYVEHGANASSCTCPVGFSGPDCSCDASTWVLEIQAPSSVAYQASSTYVAVWNSACDGVDEPEAITYQWYLNGVEQATVTGLLTISERSYPGGIYEQTGLTTSVEVQASITTSTGVAQRSAQVNVQALATVPSVEAVPFSVICDDGTGFSTPENGKYAAYDHKAHVLNADQDDDNVVIEWHCDCFGVPGTSCCQSDTGSVTTFWDYWKEDKAPENIQWLGAVDIYDTEGSSTGVAQEYVIRARARKSYSTTWSNWTATAKISPKDAFSTACATTTMNAQSTPAQAQDPTLATSLYASIRCTPDKFGKLATLRCSVDSPYLDKLDVQNAAWSGSVVNVPAGSTTAVGTSLEQIASSPLTNAAIIAVPLFALDLGLEMSLAARVPVKDSNYFVQATSSIRVPATTPGSDEEVPLLVQPMQGYAFSTQFTLTARGFWAPQTETVYYQFLYRSSDGQPHFLTPMSASPIAHVVLPDDIASVGVLVAHPDGTTTWATSYVRVETRPAFLPQAGADAYCVAKYILDTEYKTAVVSENYYQAASLLSYVSRYYDAYVVSTNQLDSEPPVCDGLRPSRDQERVSGSSAETDLFSQVLLEFEHVASLGRALYTAPSNASASVASSFAGSAEVFYVLAFNSILSDHLSCLKTSEPHFHADILDSMQRQVRLLVNDYVHLEQPSGWIHDMLAEDLLEGIGLVSEYVSLTATTECNWILSEGRQLVKEVLAEVARKMVVNEQSKRIGDLIPSQHRLIQGLVQRIAAGDEASLGGNLLPSAAGDNSQVRVQTKTTPLSETTVDVQVIMLSSTLFQQCQDSQGSEAQLPLPPAPGMTELHLVSSVQSVASVDSDSSAAADAQSTFVTTTTSSMTVSGAQSCRINPESSLQCQQAVSMEWTSQGCHTQGVEMLESGSVQVTCQCEPLSTLSVSEFQMAVFQPPSPCASTTEVVLLFFLNLCLVGCACGLSIKYLVRRSRIAIGDLCSFLIPTTATLLIRAQLCAYYAEWVSSPYSEATLIALNAVSLCTFALSLCALMYLVRRKSSVLRGLPLRLMPEKVLLIGSALGVCFLAELVLVLSSPDPRVGLGLLLVIDALAIATCGHLTAEHLGLSSQQVTASDIGLKESSEYASLEEFPGETVRG